ncbi:MAG: RlmE family RNA methyltransferase [Holosporaceae bacterium]|jgi:23S rRNA (uridine2552-2'-O)-methyltransferase|nr:RlmE family RNA methyltransferase [Holosporaceae bacterium]
MKIKGNWDLSSRMWLNRQINDPYVKLARRNGYRSRAAFKLLEMDDKFHLIKNAKRIIDLGAAPGGWSQALSQRSSDKAKILAVDLLPFDSLDKVDQFCMDFEDEDARRKIMDHMGGRVDLIVSDMAPPAVGHAQTDHARIMRLVESARSFALEVLEKGGTFATKIFQGGREKFLLESMKKEFQKVCFFKPKSSRSLSAEIYIVAMGLKK